MPWLLLVFWSRDMIMYLILSEFSYSPMTLLATIKVSAFSFIVGTFYPIIFTSSTQTRCWSVPFNMNPFWFTWTILMAYSWSKVEKQWRWNISFFQTNPNREHVRQNLVSIVNMSHKCLPTPILLYISVRQIFNSLTKFLGIPNSMSILYKTFLLTES